MLPQKSQPNLTNGQRAGVVLLVSTILTFFLSNSPAVNAQKYSEWSTPVNLGGVTNSSSNDQQPAISKNGLSLYFASNRPGGFGGFDMYVSHRTSVEEPWQTPVNLGSTVNTPVNEGNPAFSRDEHLMFFQSDRPGGLGGIDIWVCQRKHTLDDFDWQAAVNAGTGINSSGGDQSPSYFESDEGGNPQLYFASSRPGGLGGLDIFISTQADDGSFGLPVRIVELSSPGGDARPSIRHDGLEIFFQSDRAGTTGVNDLWVSTRASTLDLWSTPIDLGSAINTTFVENNPYLSSDGTTLFFVSDRPGGFGAQDLYVTNRTKIRGNSEN